jgi:hypothetical protein
MIDFCLISTILFREITERLVSIFLCPLQVVLNARKCATNGGYPCQLPSRLLALSREQPLRNVVDAASTGIKSAGVSQEACPGKAKCRIAGVPFYGKRIEPVLHKPQLPAPKLYKNRAFEHLNNELNIISVNCVVEGLFRQVMRQIPSGGSAMEVRKLIGVVAVQLFMEKVGKQPVIAEPLSAVVQRYKEQIVSFQGFQPPLPAFPPSDGIA